MTWRQDEAEGGRERSSIHTETNQTEAHDDRKAIAVIGVMMVLALGFERIPIPLPVAAAAIPGYTLLAVAVALPVVLYTRRVVLTPLSKVVFLFVLFMIIHSIAGVLVDLTLAGAGAPRVIAWIRQVISITAGTAVFLVTREIVSEQSDRQVITLGLLAAALPILVATMTATTALLNVGAPGAVADVIRQTLELRALNRSAGLSLEPSHFGYYLATGVTPLLIAGFYADINDRALVLGSIGVAVSLIGAASVTSGIVMFGLFGSAVLFGPRRRVATILAVVIFGCGMLVLVLAPNSYPAIQIKDLITGNWNLSIQTRAWSTLGPLRAYVLTPRAMLGYGLGGVSVHLPTLVPESAIAGIRGVTYNQMPNLNSMLGRILADGGVVGATLFIWMFRTALRQALHVQRALKRPALMTVAPLALGAIAVGSAIGYGSFALPFLWFWLALIDKRYISVVADENRVK